MFFLYKFFLRYRPEDQNFLPFFRVATGILVLVHFVAELPDFNVLYGDQGLIDSNIMRVFKPWFIPDLASLTNWMTTTLGVGQDTALFLFKIVFILCCAGLISGLLTRASALGLLILNLILIKGSLLYSYGVDTFSAIAIFYCLVFPTGSRLSVDVMIFKKKFVNPSPYRKLLQVHLCWVYLTSGIEKAIGSGWRSGETFWQSIHLLKIDPIIDSDFGFMAYYPIIPLIGGWFIVLLEISYAFLIWKKKYRTWVLAITCSMHLGIGLLLGLYYFSALMVLLNIAAFGQLDKYHFSPKPELK